MRLPKKPLSSLPFPRRPSSEEKIVLKRVFDEKLMNLGLYPHEYYRDLTKYVLEWTFDSWSEVKKGFNKLIRMIKSGRIYDLRARKIEPPGKMAVYWKTTDEYVKHVFFLFATDTYRIYIGGIDEIVEEVNKYKWAEFEVERDEALRIIIESWKKKDDARYSDLTKDQVAAILEVPIHEIDRIEEEEK